MYTGHFGLDDGPFHGKAEGQEVYIGARQAAVITRLRKVLASDDIVTLVSGPIGVGKSTLVRRALADLAGSKIIVPVDRMRLEPDEVLDLLLSRFDVSRPPKGTIQRVAAFRRLLHERLANDTRVCIVVEDAERVGMDALLELEALTATDSGDSVGANIVLMGAGELSEFVAKPALARLRQRIRLRQAIAPFDETEVEGYMRHCLESAGGVLEQIFEPGTACIVYRYSGGIARVVDNLCEAALVAAAEAGLATILPEFLQQVAENCGLESPVPEVDPPADERADVSAEVGAPVGKACQQAEARAEDEPPAPLIAASKLALVESLSSAADEVDAREAGDLQDPAPSQPETTAEPGFHPPAVDEGPGYGREADPAQPAGQWGSTRANVTASRIDQVLPELIERLQSHARGRARTTADGLQQAASSDDPADIPTSSSSMRLAVLPVRPMEERPWTAGGVDLDVDESMASAEAKAEDVRPSIACEAGERHESSGDSTGIAPAPSEPRCEVEPEAELTVDAIAEVVPVEAAVEDPADFERSPVPENESAAPAPVVAEESGDEVTTGAAVLSFGEDLMLATDTATDVLVAGETNDADDAGEPELDALEAAIQATNAWQASETGEDADPAPQAPPQAADLPEITLDVELEKRQAAPNDLDRFADELSKATSLEDISDILAETIFGNEEAEAISAGIRARKAAERTADAGAAPASRKPQLPASKAPAPRPSPPIRPSTAATSRPQPKTPGRPAAGSGINMTLSQRIEMVNSLNGRKPLRPVPGMRVSEIVLAERPDEPLPSGANGPQPIEAQIDTAVTRSRKVLSKADLARLASPDDDDDDDGGKRGLFGFFRRSSRN